MSKLQLVKFIDVDLADPFFNTLKKNYTEFGVWFKRKSEDKCYVLKDIHGLLDGFLYLKLEKGPVVDLDPIINCKLVLKIGTFKINPHSTRLGERFIKKALDHAIFNKAEACYVTLFDEHKELRDLFMKYGFEEHGVKKTCNGTEIVLVKNLKVINQDILKDYPLVNAKDKKKYLLAIYPEFHTKLFPDSILRNESFNILEDVSHTNSIHKIYISGMPVNKANRGDILIIYRTSDKVGPAEYRSVATSICIVEEVKSKGEFRDFEHFFKYANTYSVFDEVSLKEWYSRKKFYTIKMTYNAALTKRLTRQRLADEVGLRREVRWSFIKLCDDKFRKIVELGEVNEGIVINELLER